MPVPDVAVVSLSTTCWGAEESLLVLAARAPARVLVAAPRGELLERADAIGLATLVVDEPRLLRCREVGVSITGLQTTAVLLAAVPALVALPIWRAAAVVSFSQWLHLPLALAGRRRRRRVVLDLHDGPFSRGGAAVQSVAAWGATARVAVSQTALRHIGSSPSRRTAVVPRPVVLPAGLDGPDRPSRPEPSGGRPLRVVVVGRLDPEKRIDVALAAQALLAADGRVLSLDVVGAPSRGSVADSEFPGRWPAASYHGRLPPDRALSIVAAADVLVSTTAGEAFGRTILEAALLGVPSVVCGGGPAERVREGVTGWVVPPHDPAALAARLAQLADDRALVRRAGDLARAEAAAVAQPDAVARAWLDAVLA